MGDPRAVFGVASYNHASEAREAIESILGQTYKDFAVVIVDDCSTDGTEEILRAHATAGSRVHVIGNSSRVGMIENWRRAFQKAREFYPEAEFFAWASDHDRWHPEWLSALVTAMDKRPDAVLAYPLNTKVYADGSPVDRKPWYFDTADTTAPGRRLWRTAWKMSAGNMIYGLFRVGPLERAGVFRRLLMPDRMLLAELSVLGPFLQVRQVLWFRRWYGRVFSVPRQRASFFPAGAPLYAYAPWSLCHSVAFAWNVIVRRTAGSAVGFWVALQLSVVHAAAVFPLNVVQTARTVQRWLGERMPTVSDRLRSWVGRTRQQAKIQSRNVRSRMRRARKKLRTSLDDAIRIPGVAFLKFVRRLPLVRSRVIPWLVREEIRQIPASHSVMRLRDKLTRIAGSRGPIIVGPWVSEVGFELLYWIPFLNWATREFGLTKDRAIAVTRGGAASWYADLCDRSVDLFDLLAPEAYRAGNADRSQEAGHQKQFEVTDDDRAIVTQALDRLGCGDAALLHPSLMYNLYRYYWYEKGSISLLRDHGEFRRLPKPGPVPPGLPRTYVAVRFYFRPSFPDTPENRAFLATTIRTLASHIPVVLLNTGITLDDHEDFWPNDLPGVYDVRAMMTPGGNLDTQTRIIAGARAFVGTYGGLAYLGPLLGVPSVGVYSEMNHIIPAHLDVSDRLSAAMNTPMVTLDVKASGLLQWIFDRPCPEHRVAASAPDADPSSAERTEP